MASVEIFQYFIELENFFATAGHTPNDTNSLESISRHLEDHISIIVTFLVVMSDYVEQNPAARTLYIILEGIYESLWEMLTEITVQVEAVRHTHSMDTHSPSQRGRPR